MAVSPDCTRLKVDQFAVGFNNKVAEWKEQIECFFRSMQVNRLLTFTCKLYLLLRESEDYPTYQIIGDNVDIHQRASHQSMERRDTDHHWFHLYAVKTELQALIYLMILQKLISHSFHLTPFSH